uniref:lysoplasmalogenase n=1 Tax=Onchocerca volvulus TaxID=6282 RepID=A0A2K6W9X0_ONCVO
MFDLPLLNLAEVLAVYGGLCGLLYVGTDGFYREAPFLNSIPTLSLTILTLTLRVKGTIKLLTSLTFLVLAFSVYLYSSQWHNNLQTVCALFTIAHISYILSFILSLRRLWFGCAVVVITYVIAFLYFCFVDLFWSIPILVLNFCLLFMTLATSVISAGSIWHYGSKRENAEQQAALLRFLGLLSFMAYVSLLLLNRFGNRIDRSNYISILLFCIGQLLLFIANARAF